MKIIDGKAYKKIDLKDLDKEELIKMIEDLQNNPIITYRNLPTITNPLYVPDRYDTNFPNTIMCQC